MLFTENKYTRIYYRIVEHRKSNPSSEQTESHHIIPQCLGGTNDPDNLVALTLREHYVCHILLVKMTQGEDRMRMARAAHGFKRGRPDLKVTNSRIYEMLKREMGATAETKQRMRDAWKLKKARGYNNQHRIGAGHTAETRKKMSDKNAAHYARGGVNGFAGKKHNEETRAVMSEKAKKRPITKVYLGCVKCHREMDKGNFTRHEKVCYG